MPTPERASLRSTQSVLNTDELSHFSSRYFGGRISEVPLIGEGAGKNTSSDGGSNARNSLSSNVFIEEEANGDFGFLGSLGTAVGSNKPPGEILPATAATGHNKPSVHLKSQSQESLAEAVSRTATVSLGSRVPPVEQKIYLKYIKSQLDMEAACLELPFTLLLLISFSFAAMMHLNQQSVFAVEQAIEQDIHENANFAFSHAFGHKGLVDVHSFADFWSWLRLGLLPLMVQETWAYSEDYASDAATRFTNANLKFSNPPSRWRIGAFGGGAKIPVKGDYLRYNKIIGGLRFRQIGRAVV